MTGEDTTNKPTDSVNSKQNVSNVDLLDGIVTGPIGQQGLAGMSPMLVVAQPGYMSLSSTQRIMPAGSGMAPSGFSTNGGMMQVGLGGPQQHVLMGLSNASGSQVSCAPFTGPSSVTTGFTPNPPLVRKLWHLIILVFHVIQIMFRLR